MGSRTITTLRTISRRRPDVCTPELLDLELFVGSLPNGPVVMLCGHHPRFSADPDAAPENLVAIARLPIRLGLRRDWRGQLVAEERAERSMNFRASCTRSSSTFHTYGGFNSEEPAPMPLRAYSAASPQRSVDTTRARSDRSSIAGGGTGV